MGSLINISWSELEWLCSLIMARLAFSSDGKIIPFRVVFGVLGWVKGGEERAPSFPSHLWDYSRASFVCGIGGPFAQFLICPVSSATLPYCAAYSAAMTSIFLFLKYHTMPCLWSFAHVLSTCNAIFPSLPSELVWPMKHPPFWILSGLS